MNAKLIKYVKTQLSTDPAWASRALVRLLERQTSDEQASDATCHRNGMGFTGCDANILSSFAKQVNNGRTLSPKQLAIAFKKLPKYANQVISVIPDDKLAALEAKVAAMPDAPVDLTPTTTEA